METISITKGDSRLEILSWVLQARAGDDETRFFMRGLNVENDGQAQNWVATDGHRLHFYRMEDTELFLPLGNARVVSIAKNTLVFTFGDSSMASFPNWKKTIPTLNGANQFFFDESKAPFILNHTFSLNRNKLIVLTAELALTIVEIYRITNRTINGTYLLPLSGKAWVVFGARDGEGALEFQCGPYTVVIMPLRSNDLKVSNG
jgi:hypothetical protein